MRYVEQPHLLYEEKLRGVGLFSLQKAEGESFQCFKESSEWGQVLFGGACEEYGEQQVQTRTQKRKFHLLFDEKLREWQSTVTGCPQLVEYPLEMLRTNPHAFLCNLL